MFNKINLSPRYSLLFAFVLWFPTFSFILRISLIFWQYDEVSFNLFTIIGTILTGFFYDIGTISFFILPAVAFYFQINGLALG